MCLKCVCLAVLTVLGLLTVSEAQNSTCSGPEISSFKTGLLENIAKSAVYSYIAGETDTIPQEGGTSQKNIDDDDLKYLQKYLEMFDPRKIRRSPYFDILETGHVPEGPMASFKMERILERNAIDHIHNIRGPAKTVMDLLRDRPDLKYNSEGLKKLLMNQLKKKGQTEKIKTNTNKAFGGGDALQQCQLDVGYLYNSIGESLSCVIREAINGIIIEILGSCRLFIYDICLNVTSPSRPVPDITGRFIDAHFKPPPGLAQGNLHWVGDYDQCHRIADVTYNTSLMGMVPAEMRTFQGHYCRLGISLGISSENGSDFAIPLYLGFCLPDSCAAPEVIANVTESYEILGMKVNEMFCGNEPVVLEENSFAMATTVIGFSLVILVALASLYDMLIRKWYLRRKLKQLMPHLERPSLSDLKQDGAINSVPVSSNDEVTNIYDQIKEPVYVNNVDSILADEGDNRPAVNNTPNGTNTFGRPPSFVSQVSTMSTSDLLNNELGAKKKVGVADALDEPPNWTERLEGMFVALSAFSNTLRLFNTTNISDRLISCDGVRFLSLVWSTYGLTWLFGTVYSEAWTTANLLPIVLNNTRTFLFQIINNFTFSADSTFVVAGCLLTYKWLNQYHKTQRITWKTMVHYYVHRYIRLALPLILLLVSYTYISQVAVAGPLSPTGIEDAEFCQSQWYLSLFLLHNLIKTDTMCLSWTFHVGMIFQFHIVAPLILIPLVLKPKLGALVGGAFCLANLIVLGIMAGEMADGGGFGYWYTDILMAPWCRIGPFLVGMATGYALHINKQKPFKIPYIARAIIWVCCIACLMAPIFCTYDALQDNHEWNRAQRINYQLWGRTAFGLGVAWLIFSAEIGVGGFPGRFLHYRLWIPMSKLSYMTLLCSAMFIFQNVYSQVRPIVIDSHLMMYFFFGNMTMSLLVALGLIMVFQFPFYEMENALFYFTRRDIVKMGRNPLSEMTKSAQSEDVTNNPITSRSASEGFSPPGGLKHSESDKPLVNYHRSVSQSSQL